jgi:hypothetical protein
MSRKNKAYKIRGQFTPLFYETTRSPAWKQLSLRALFIALRMRCFKNNGHVYLSQREAEEELGRGSRNHIANWYRELGHYGFIVKTEAASLGVDGKGKAPHWRITDLPTGSGGETPATKDFLRWDGTVFEPHVRPSWKWNARKQAALKKQNPGRDVEARVDVTSVPLVDVTSEPLEPEGGSNVTPIQANPTGSNVTPITKLATGVAGAGLRERTRKERA